MSASLFSGKVVNNECVNPQTFLLEISVSEKLPKILPGHFFLLGVPSFFLRRPVSVYSHDGNKLGFLIRKKGSGTEALSRLRTGDSIELSGPHGTPALLPEAGTTPLLVAGGIGFAPISFLGNHLKKSGFEPVFIYGENFTADFMFTDLVKRNFRQHYFTAPDAGHDSPALATDALTPVLTMLGRENVTIYACGPSAMYRAMLAQNLTTPKTYVYLEERMACGIGACMGCSVKTKSGYKRVCADGPVFSIFDIDFGEGCQ